MSSVQRFVGIHREAEQKRIEEFSKGHPEFDAFNSTLKEICQRSIPGVSIPNQIDLVDRFWNDLHRLKHVCPEYRIGNAVAKVLKFPPTNSELDIEHRKEFTLSFDSDKSELKLSFAYLITLSKESNKFIYFAAQALSEPSQPILIENCTRSAFLDSLRVWTKNKLVPFEHIKEVLGFALKFNVKSLEYLCQQTVIYWIKHLFLNAKSFIELFDWLDLKNEWNQIPKGIEVAIKSKFLSDDLNEKEIDYFKLVIQELPLNPQEKIFLKSCITAYLNRYLLLPNFALNHRALIWNMLQALSPTHLLTSLPTLEDFQQISIIASLRTLSINHWGSLRAQILPGRIYQHPQLEKLEVLVDVGVFFTYGLPFCKTIFPNVKTLVLFFNNHSGSRALFLTSENLKCIPLYMPNLEELQIGGSFFPEENGSNPRELLNLKGLSELESLKKLKRLTLYDVKFTFDNFNKLCQELSHLEEIHIKHYQPVAQPLKNALKQCSELKSIKIEPS